MNIIGNFSPKKTRQERVARSQWLLATVDDQTFIIKVLKNLNTTSYDRATNLQIATKKIKYQ